MIGDVATIDGPRAFVGLLTRPLVTLTTDPELHRQVTRNMKAVEDHARRLAYRVTTIGRVIRLVRPPIAGVVTIPPPPIDLPNRHILALACVLAAACEETAGTTTIAKLSELVGELTNGPDSPVASYEQARAAHRRALLHAARILEHWGVLQRRLADERLLDQWADSGEGSGTLYTVDREALLLLTNPDVLATVLEMRPAQQPDAVTDADGDRGVEAGTGIPVHADPDQWGATRAVRMLRALVESPSVVYDDLEFADAEMLRATRGLRSAEAEGMTGGHVEARREGLLLVLPEQHLGGATVDWPRAESGSWAALVALDEALRLGTRGADGVATVSSAAVDALAEAIVNSDRGKYLKKDMRSAAAVRSAAEAHLSSLGMLTTSRAGQWRLSPVAARYRDPEISIPEPVSSPDTPATGDPGADRSGEPQHNGHKPAHTGTGERGSTGMQEQRP